MTVILVDDEPLALRHLEALLNKVCDLKIVGTYTKAREAKYAILEKQPKVVFLDIEMPEVNGLKLAEQIQEVFPDIHIVFVTAYNEYAVKAFELNAVDYIVKPIELSRLQKTVRRFPKFKDKAPPVNMICTFQSLSFERFEEGVSEVVDVKWRTTKARSIFVLLLHHRKKLVNRDDLLEIFWPETDADRARTQLYSTIYQIRRTLSQTGFDVTITSEGNGYQLHLNETKYDIDAWENGLLENDVVTTENLAIHLELLAIYRGDYLCDENYVWAEQERERLRALALQHLTKLGKFYESQNHFGDAVSIYLRIQKMEPYVDRSYFLLMKAYSRVKAIHAVEQQYNNLKEMLSAEHGLEPSKEIQLWYSNWLKHVAADE